MVQTEAGQVIGFASGGVLRGNIPPYTGELYAIYLLESYQKQGLGSRLFDTVKKRLQETGFSSMLLWVLTENNAARCFYEARGGKPIKTQEFELGGITLEETGYSWTSID